MTDLKVAGLEECWEKETGQIVESAGVLVTTHETFATVVSRKHLTLDQCRLVIVDNVQASFQPGGSSPLVSLYNSVARNQAPRLVTITPHLLASNTDPGLSSLPRQLSSLASLIPASVETACEIATQLRFLARPSEVIISFSLPDLDTQTSLELRIRNMLEELKVWIIDQNYSLVDVYGDEFGDLIAEIPDPTQMPLQIIADFLTILSELGVWCADRAALLFMIKIDKLKTREKYERHFLLLSVLFSIMVRIRKMCDDSYGDMSDLDKLATFSRPKLTRLVELLTSLSPGVPSYPAPVQEVKEAKEGEQEAPAAAPAQPPAPARGGRRFGGRRLGQTPEDPDNLCSLVIVNSAFSAKILYHYLKDLSRSRPELSYLCPQYAVQDPLPSDPRDVDSERKKQEEALRRFRMRECNILVSSSVLEEGIDFVKCNLVIMFDPPSSFHRYIYTKVKAKSVGGSLVHLSHSTEDLVSDLKRFKCLEVALLSQCTNPASDPHEDAEADSLVHLCPSYPPSAASTPASLSLSNAILVLNRYCAKLPSDTFTRLTPSWTVEPASDGGHYCVLFLPINSPLKGLVVGKVMPSAALARRSAAYTACVQLHQAGELDSNMVPVGKESLLTKEMITITKGNEWNGDEVARPGTTKRRQYYYKKVAKCLLSESRAKGSTENAKIITEIKESSKVHKFYESEEDAELKRRYEEVKVPEAVTFSLYILDMRLTCPIPEEQNTRGRKIHDPSHSDLQLGLLLSASMPPVPSFPIYTRSGEVMVTVTKAASDVSFTPEQLVSVCRFHMFTFSSVLRLDKYPMEFSPQMADNSLVVVPIKQGLIDWDFLSLISSLATRRLRYIPDNEREKFEFISESYTDAVIMPWYRNQDHPQYFYVAEICDHLSPASDFPGQGFETFSKYYSTKYSINIQNSSQPLLDVDHTSARLNFLTPRYVNRKGIALPTSSEETKRNKRENLEQKQILVPELCAIHPFPASLWRQTVSLPCILYRLNGLLISNQIRMHVAIDMRLGISHVPSDHTWPALNFGWTLADVINSGKKEAKETIEEEKNVKKSSGKEGDNKNDEMGEFGEWNAEMMDEEVDMSKVADKLMNKLALDEKAAKKKKLEIGMWTNEMAASDMPAPGLEDKEDGGVDWGKTSDGEEEDIDMAGIELPDNLTFINSKGVMGGVEGKSDWVTGIQAKNFRVGSPTFFSNNSNMAGLMDDLEGYSCSDSEESWAGDDMEDSEMEGTVGGARIEFHGDNVAETIEGEEEGAAREERVARDRDQEASMVSNVEWDPASLLEDTEVEVNFDDTEISVEIIPEDKEVIVRKPSEVIKAQAAAAAATETEARELETPNVDHDTVLRHMNLCPDLDLVPAPSKEAWGVIPWPGIDSDTGFSFDEQPQLENHTGPSPTLILQALTMSNSNDAINLERLETIGDSFLKYAITTFLFCQHPNIHEGKLSHLRSKVVSNLNLYMLGQARGLGECMVATKFEPHDNWLPPCYHVPRELEMALIESGVPSSYWNMADLPGVQEMSMEEICNVLREKCGDKVTGGTESDKEIQSIPSFIPYNLLTQHSIPDKSIADCVEALIGAYLISCGPRGALILMTWLGLEVLPKDDQGRPLSLQSPPSPLIATPAISSPERHLSYLLDGFSKFEHMIGYVWRDKAYLLQAFSHASFYPNRLTDCYQRLEFLGDAVLDYLITRHLYEVY